MYHNVSHKCIYGECVIACLMIKYNNDKDPTEQCSRSAHVNKSQHLILRFPQAMCLRLYLPCIQHKTAHGLILVLFLRCCDANFKTLQGIRKQTFFGLLLVFSHLTLKSTSLPILQTKPVSQSPFLGYYYTYHNVRFLFCGTAV